MNYFAHETAVIDKGASIGDGTKIWHFSHISPGAKIGKNCKLGQNVFVQNDVSIGDCCKIQNNVSIYGGVTLEDHVFCGPSAVFTNITNPRCKYPQETADKYVKTLLKEGTSLGANCTIVCGTTLGKHSFVGAGSVVTKDIPDYGLVYGNPAKLKGWMCECGTKLEFKGDKATCEKCSMQYSKNGEKVSPLSK